jgi:hypothetical protein
MNACAVTLVNPNEQDASEKPSAMSGFSTPIVEAKRGERRSFFHASYECL